MSTPLPALDPYDERAQPSVSPFELLRVIWRRKVLAGFVVVVVTGIAVALSSSQPKQYEASASLLFRNPGFASALGGTDIFSNGADPERDAQTNIDVVHSRAVADVVRRELGTQESSDSLLDSVTVSPSSDSDVATVTANRASPEDAAELANAFASGYIDYRREADRRTIREAKVLLQQTLGNAPEAERAARASRVQQLEQLEVLQTGNAEVVARAAPDSSPTSPRPRRDAILGLIVGGLLGCGLALLADFLDKRLQNQEDVEGAYPDFPVIGQIPDDKRGSRAVTPTGRTGEAFRVMREGLRFVDPDRQARCILVTSADEGEGKSTVARQLAAALATVEHQVVLIEADMRRPTASAALGVHPRSKGLSDLLVSTESPERLLALPNGFGSPLAVLPAGTAPPNPADLLRSSRMGEIIDSLLSFADLIIIDAPPLDPVADTRTLLQLPQIDAVLFIARVGVTRRDRAREARRVLAQSGRKVLGLVIVGTASIHTSYYDDGPPTGRSSRLNAFGNRLVRS